MNKKAILLVLLVISFQIKAQYNTMWIPDTLSGTDFNLTIKDTFAQIVNSGNQTITGGINGKIWGPTMFINKGDVVHMNVTNKLNDSTTIHWHGMHLPAVMDGGPHQVIPPNTTWQPFWTVKNDAATYWYHPHLHEMTEEQMTKGIGGLLIVRDEVESSLALPRSYGVDDIPLVLTDRDINTSNQFTVVPYGDSMLTNMTLRAQYNVPAQVIRFRVLNGAVERSYNLGFSDGRTFYIITSDGGLLNAPVAKTKYLIHAGERIEILVNCAGESGKSIDLKAYNSTLAQNVPGGDFFPNGPFANYLARKDFNILHINIVAQTSNPVTSIPTALRTVTPIPAANSELTRNLTISDSTIAGVQGATFLLNHKLFDINYNNYAVPLNQTEIWEISNSGNFGHPFHIHDVEFNILSVNGVAPDAAQAGWKDVVFVPAISGGTPSVVKFIAKFDDYADALHPFMFHCHIALHEDEGMMGQFIVTSANSLNDFKNLDIPVNLFPNPANGRLYIQFDNVNQSAYYITIFDYLGRTKMMLPKPELENGIDISLLSKGVYHLTIIENSSKKSITKSFIVN
jgi:blue copper oxidase